MTGDESKDSLVTRKPSRKEDCRPCKIIAYCATLGLTCYGLASIKRQPAPGALLSAIGLVGLSTFIYRDITR